VDSADQHEFSALLKKLFNASHRGLQESSPRSGVVAGRFELIREIGRGGFGVVYEARDRELGRNVALKLLPEHQANVAADRLLREAEAAARLSHPNIVAVYDVGRDESGPYLVLELLRGKTLATRLKLGALPIGEALRIAAEIAEGLAHAHSRGVVHRDLTPCNVFVCDDGQAKLLDLGLAHAFGRPKVDGGTRAYMAPEQRIGAPEDERTDVFALGVVLFQMLSGELPLVAERQSDSRECADALQVPEEPGLGELVARMLQPDPVKRPRDAHEVLLALRTFEQELRRSGPTGAAVRKVPRRSRPRRALLAMAATVLCVVVVWYVQHELRVRSTLKELTRIADLVDLGQYSKAVALASKAEQVIPGHPMLRKLWPEMSRIVTFETDPPGAEVYVREYLGPRDGWRHLGRSPLRQIRLPWVLHEVRIEKEGYSRIDAVPSVFFSEIKVAAAEEQPATLHYTLDRTGTIPAEMVRVPRGTVKIQLLGLEEVPAVELGDFLIDRTEVTNRQFKVFVDAGGYARHDLWRHQIVKNGRVVPWGEATALFLDRTGRSGPATWIAGSYPDGQGDLPVTGVSWYEAEAYAAFVGKTLPNLYQWSHAAGTWATSDLVPFSNFTGKGLAAVGSYDGVGPFGTVDMAGNAKEWCWNGSEAGRYILGGAWDESTYMFNAVDAQPPWAREPNYGFRLVKELDDATAPAARAAVPYPRPDALDVPVPDDLFRVFKRLYAYDRGPLNAEVEAVDETSERWRKEKVSFAAAYGDERVIAYLFTPRNVRPPFQTVVFFPGSSAILSRSSAQLTLLRMVSPLLSSGRAVLYPIYKSTYERRDSLTSPFPVATASYRDHVIAWSKDLGRSIDYIETRGDLDARRIALYGVSWGARMLPIMAAIEDRVRVGIMVGGGISRSDVMPEANPVNFAPRVRQPMLMVNGRYDFLFPVEIGQQPLFRLLGSQPNDKRHVVFDTGHQPPNDLLTKEVLDWLDRYFGTTR